MVPAAAVAPFGESRLPLSTAAPRLLYTSTAIAVVTRLLMAMAFLLGLLTVVLFALLPVDPQPSSVGMAALATGSIVVGLLGLRIFLLRLPRLRFRREKGAGV